MMVSDLGSQNARLVRVGWTNLTNLWSGCWRRETGRRNETIAVLLLNLLKVSHQFGRVVIAHGGDPVANFTNLVDDGIRHWIHDQL